MPPTIYCRRISLRSRRQSAQLACAPSCAAVRDHATPLMFADNAVNGFPMCASPLLQTVLRNQFNFTGFVVSGAWGFVPDMQTAVPSRS